LKRVVISDTHIGSKFYKEEELYSFLESEEYDQLILNGDIIEFLKIPTFTEGCMRIIKSVDYGKEIIYIIGNHDKALAQFADSEMFGIRFMEQYEFESAGRKFRIEHGDRYERGIVHYRTAMKIISVFQDFLERYLNLDVSTWFNNLKINKRKIKRLWDIIDLNNDVDVLIVGHTHIPEAVIWIDENENIKTYVNSGDWVSHSTYVEINDGVVRLRNYLKK
jgi:UDP-2,3-diacylglucosamine pyrophosphatase LpxH|tara:strand:+ start:923 stop:1585 length:663 start_codon:yes stop_codon:yes gene_type:complete